MSEPSVKIPLISDEYEYSNIQIKLPSHIICIRIYAISRVRIYSDIRLVKMWHPNIFVYSFGTYCSIRIYLNICLCQFYDICSSLRNWLEENYTFVYPW